MRVPEEDAEIELRFWPLRVTARGPRAVLALKWPVTLIVVALGLATATVIFAKGVALIIGSQT
jgi:hypothetical protein